MQSWSRFEALLGWLKRTASKAPTKQRCPKSPCIGWSLDFLYAIFCAGDLNCGIPGDIGANFSEQVRSAEVLNKQCALQNPLSPSPQVIFFFCCCIPLIIHLFHAGGVDPWRSCLKGGVSEAQIVKPGVRRRWSKLMWSSHQLITLYEKRQKAQN